MDHRLGILEIKHRMETEFSEKVQQHWRNVLDKHNKCQRENPEKHQIHVKNYEKTEKGKIAVKRRRATRERRVRNKCSELSYSELEQIKQFYVDCPQGMVVDHIIPLSRGGNHHISNLQYLPPLINFKKKDRLPQELIDCEWYQPYLVKND